MLRDDQLVDIVLDKPRKMLFTWLALNKAQREINKLRGEPPTASIFVKIDELRQMLISDEANFPIDLLQVLLWASLLHEEPDLTLEQVDRWNTTNMPAVMAKISRALVPLFSPGSEDAVMSQVLEEKKTVMPMNGRASGDSPESNLG